MRALLLRELALLPRVKNLPFVYLRMDVKRTDCPKKAELMVLGALGWVCGLYLEWERYSGSVFMICIVILGTWMHSHRRWVGFQARPSPRPACFGYYDGVYMIPNWIYNDQIAVQEIYGEMVPRKPELLAMFP